MKRFGQRSQMLKICKPTNAIRRTSVAVALAVLVATAGCAGDRSGLPNTTAPAWTYRGHALLKAVASEKEGILVVEAESPRRIIALEAASGREIWSAEAGGRLLICDGGVTLAQAPATFSRDAAEVIAFDTRTGAELWRTSQWRAHPAPRLKAGMAVGLTVKRTFEAVDARTGERIFAADPSPNIAPSALPPYREDPDEQDAWGPSALTESGRLAYRGPGSSLVVIDFRAKSVTTATAPEIGQRAGIISIGENVVVVGSEGRAKSPAPGAYWIQGFDTATAVMTWSKHVAGRSPKSVDVGPGGTVLVLDTGPGADQHRAARLYNAVSGEEPWPTPFTCSEQESIGSGRPFGDFAIFKTGRQMSACAVPGWQLAWKVDTQDPDDDYRKPLIAANDVLFMKTDTTTKRYAGSFVSESRITAFDLTNGAFLWRFVGEQVDSIAAVGDLAIGVGSNRVVALPLHPRPRGWWPF